jgi:hypothetical protein
MIFFLIYSTVPKFKIMNLFKDALSTSCRVNSIQPSVRIWNEDGGNAGK